MVVAKRITPRFGGVGVKPNLRE
jgi:hypothetical protein